MTGVIVPVTSDSAAAKRDLRQVEASLGRIDDATRSVGRTLKSTFSNIGAAAGLAGLVYGLKSAVDEYQQIENKIALVTGRTKELVSAQMQVFKLAADTRSSVSATAGLYSSMARALRSSQVGTVKVLEATKAIQEAVIVSGASEASASAAIMQLNQGLSAGALRGEELNSVMEQTPRIAQAIADSLKVSTGQLRILGEQGKLTSNVVFSAILAQAQNINKEFQAMAPTIGQSTNLLTDGIKQFVSQFDKGLGLSASLSKYMQSTAKYVSAAADNAFQLGTNVAVTVRRVKNLVSLISAPVASIFGSLATQFAQALPQIRFTDTFKGDLNEFIRYFDRTFLGNFIRGWKQFRFIDLVTVESDVEKAIRTLKRLSPKYWAASGFDRKSIVELFSARNILEYSKAFGVLAKAVASNITTIGGNIEGFAKRLNASIFSLYRYWGGASDAFVSFTAGSFENLTQTIAEITRGLFGLTARFWDIRGLIVQNWYPGIRTMIHAFKEAGIPALRAFAKATVEVVLYAIKYFTAFGEAISEIFRAKSFKSMAADVFDLIFGISDAISNLADFDSPLKKIENFAKKVIYYFFTIYDEVIGNSWWTDTVLAIINSSATLWEKSKTGIVKFYNNFTGYFRSIYNNISGSFKNSLRVPEIKFNVMQSKSSFEKLYDLARATFADMKRSALDFAKEYPSIFSMAIIGIAGIIAKLVLPFSSIGTVLLASLGTELALNSTVLADSIFKSLFDASAINAAATKFGETIGFLVTASLKSLPEILTVILGGVASAFRGFLTNIGFMVGDIFTSIFSIADKVGLGTPLGLIGALLFGAGAARLAGQTDLVKKATAPLKYIVGLFKDGEDDKGKTIKAPLGAIGSWLFGTFGVARVVGSIGLVTSALGIFDNLFINSPLAELAANGGLLYLLFAGNKGFDKIKTSVVDAAILPVITSIKTLAAKNSKTIFDLLFGSGTFGDRVADFGKAVFTKINTSVVDFATPYVSAGVDFLTTAFLGKDPKATLSNVKKQFSDIAGTVSAQINKASASMGLSSIMSSFSGIFAGSQNYSRKYSNLMASTFGATQRQASSASKFAETIGGDQGLLGRMFLGKYGKAILVGSILSVFATFTMAATTTQKSLEDLSLTEQISRDFEALKNNNPVAAVLLASLPLIAAAAFLFRRQIGSQLSKVFDVSNIKRWSTTSIDAIRAVAAKRKALLAGVGAGAVGAGAGFLTTGSLVDAISLGVLAAQFGFFIRKALYKAVAWAFSTVFSAAVMVPLFKIAAVALGALSLGGMAYIFLFGENDFLTDMDLAIDKMKEFFGFKNKNSKSTKLSEEQTKAVQDAGISLSYDLSKIDPKKIATKDRDRLDATLEKLKESITQAAEEQALLGITTEDTKNNIRQLDKSLANLVSKIDARNSLKSGDLAKQIQDISNRDPKSLAGKFVLALDQTALDFEYTIREFSLKLLRFASDKDSKGAVTRDLEALTKLKDTRFNAKFVPLSPDDRQAVDLSKELRTFKYTNDQLMTEIGVLENAYREAFTEVAKAENTLFGRVDKLSEDDQRKFDLRFTRDILLDSYNKAKLFDKQSAKAADFKQQIEEISASFNALNISFDSKELSLKDDDAMDRAKFLAAQLRILAKEFEMTADLAERREIILRVTEIRSQVEDLKFNAEKSNPAVRKQFQLEDLANQAGIAVFSKETYQRLSDADAEALNATLLQIIQKRKDIQKKFQGDAASLNPLTGERLLSLGATKSIESETAAIDQATREFTARVKEAAGRSAKGNKIAMQELASSVGLDFDELVIAKGYDAAVQAVKRAEGLSEKIKDATNPAELRTNLRNYKNLLDQLKEAPTTASEVLNQASSISGIQLEDITKLAPKAFEALRTLAFQGIQQEKAFSKLDASASRAQFANYLTAKAKQAKDAFAIMLSTIGNTVAKTVTILEGFGVRDEWRIALFEKEDLKRFTQIQVELEKLKNERLTLSPESARFQATAKEIVRLQTEADILSKKFESFDEVVANVNDTLGLSLSKSVFANLPEELRKQLSSTAFDQRSKVLNTAPNDASGLLGIDNENKVLAARFSKLILEAGTEFSVALQSLPYETRDSLISKISEALPEGSDLRGELLKLSRDILLDLAKSALDIARQEKLFNTGVGNQKSLERSKDNFANSVVGKSNNPNAALLGSAKKFGLSQDAADFNLLGREQRARVESMLSKGLAAVDKLQVEADENTRRSLQLYVNSIKYEVESLLESAAKDISITTREAGAEFSTSVSGGFKEALSGLLKGASDEGSSVFKTFVSKILDTFTSNVIDTFVSGLTNAVSGKDSFLMKSLQSIGANMFEFGAKALSGLLPTGDSGGQSSSNPVVSAISTLGVTLLAPLVAMLGLTATSTGFDLLGVSVEQAQLIYLGTLGITIPAAIAASTAAIVAAIAASAAASAAGGALGGVGGFLGVFANGGRISGPGTGTSDSIPIWASNGEYMVNAKATKKFLPVLEAINSGRIPKFADGGFIGSGLINDRSKLSRAGGGDPSSNTQMFNINITGDISRQTKSTIYEMIPQIAAGVNKRNREKG